MKIKIFESDNPKKKLTAIFYTDDDKKIKTIHFGAKGYEDYTEHHDKMRRERYINRHSKNEHFNDPMTAGSLSRWILWGDSTSLTTNISNFKKKFNLK